MLPKNELSKKVLESVLKYIKLAEPFFRRFKKLKLIVSFLCLSLSISVGSEENVCVGFVAEKPFVCNEFPEIKVVNESSIGVSMLKLIFLFP